MLKRISNKTYDIINGLGFDAIVSKRDGIFGVHIRALDETSLVVSFSGIGECWTSEPSKYEISSCYVDGLKPLIKGFILENNNDLINLVTVIKNYMEIKNG